VILDNKGYALGTKLSNTDLQSATQIQDNNQTVAYVMFLPYQNNRLDDRVNNNSSTRPPRDTTFLDNITQAALTSAAITLLIALLVGALLARTLTQSIRELTVATHAMASGKLGTQVNVRSKDEIGELAHSFNKMSADLERASQARKQMTADLAHDLRTPLSILRGYTEGLQESRLQGSTKIYGIMHEEVTHLQRLVEDLRTLSLADAGEIRLNKRMVNPKSLLERTALAYIMQAEQQGINLRVEADDDLPQINIDTDRMTQVLNNLVSNALRHTAQGEIVLSAAWRADRVELRVRDTGSGIAPEDVPFVFDRFYRADKSRTRVAAQSDDTASSGLGLAIVKAIIEAHGGTINIESTVGAGSTFVIGL
jgi:two-component system sensor histidine kinase BaeS